MVVRDCFSATSSIDAIRNFIFGVEKFPRCCQVVSNGENVGRESAAEVSITQKSADMRYGPKQKSGEKNSVAVLVDVIHWTTDVTGVVETCARLKCLKLFSGFDDMPLWGRTFLSS